MPYNRLQWGKKNQSPDRQSATALGYNPNTDDAPRVLATGKGFIADKILELAKENNIPIREDPILAAALASLDVDDVIPPELYAVVAEVLAYVYRIQQKRFTPVQKNLRTDSAGPQIR